MTIDKAKLKALGESSGLGEWYSAGDLRYCDDKTGEIHGLHHDDSRFIAAASPATVLALIAEIDRMEEEFDKAWRHDLNNANNVQALSAEVSRLQRESEALRKALLEASEEVATWGAYASEYFQEKHDLAGCVAKIHAAAMAKEASHG
ncbi:hypothetical protein ACLNBI_24480 [Pseudomonas guariconensis]|uniref:hypothetical protein n=1 Tax=Pseudomonas guariconensis TaxID=1288410 RepID=UPI0039EC7A31